MAKRKTKRKTAAKSTAAGAKKKRQAKPATGAKATMTVEEFWDGFDAPNKADWLAVREIILKAHRSIQEHIKWNAPTFFTTDDFATFNLRVKSGVQVILHTGAKVKHYAKTGIAIDDPKELLTWRSKDRAMLTLADRASIDANKAAVKALIGHWIKLLDV